MKKLVLTTATVLFLSGLSMATVTAPPQGDNDDSEKAQHSVSITVPTVALVDVEDASGNEADITFTFTEENLVKEAGAKLNFESITNNDLYLQYTSIISGKNSQSITAELQSSNLPDGINLLVSTDKNVKSGNAKKGKTGEGNSTFQKLEESTGHGSAKTLVSGIETCYTGTGGAYGHQLTYKLSIDDTDNAYNSLTSGNYQTTVVYTITAGTGHGQ